MDRSRLTNTHPKMDRTLWISLFGLLLCFSLVNSVPYSKYGRTCKDIGCRNNEVCVIAEDPCTYSSGSKCGRYPTCQKNGEGGSSCTTLICPSGKYCKTIDGHPECVSTSPNLEYDSAGVSSVNGHRTNTDTNENHGSSNSNINPYSNANAPPPEPNYGTNYHPVNSPNNNGYPPYPSNSGNGNSGYPSYPVSGQSNQPSSSGTNLGYPPYPTQNRMPQPGVYQQPGHYPGNLYPNNQQPGHQYPNYPYQNNYNTNSRKYHRGSAVSNLPQTFSLCSASFIILVITKYIL